MIRRIAAEGDLSPMEFVDACLDQLGPLEVMDDTRQELLVMAEKGGGLRWDTEENRNASALKVGDMFSLIAATREYQLA